MALGQRLNTTWLAMLSLALALPLASSSRRPTKAPLKLTATIPLPGLHDGDFDHFAVDLDGHRLFLTAEENSQVLVFDTNSNKLIHTISDVKAPHSLFYRSDLKKLFVVDGDEGAVKIYNSDTYEPESKIDLTADADSMTYDPATNYMYVVNGGRGTHSPYTFISVVDTSNSKKLKDIKVDGERVEAMAVEKSGPRLFCNATAKNEVAVFDRNSGQQLATWPLPEGAKQNVAMALDEDNHRLFVVTRQPGRLIVMNTDDGKAVANVPAVAMVDDAAYDQQHKRVYLAGTEFVDVFQQRDPDHYSLIARIPGSFRAKTALLVPQLSKYYLAVPHHAGKEAAVRVYEVRG